MREVPNLLNAFWQVPWLNRRNALAAIVIVGILASLIWLYIRLDRMRMTTDERWVLGVPTSLFLAWLSVATALNITIALAASGWRGSAIWPPILVLVVAGIGAALLWRTGDVPFASVLVWAFAAIYAANVPSPGGAGADGGARGGHSCLCDRGRVGAEAAAVAAPGSAIARPGLNRPIGPASGEVPQVSSRAVPPRTSAGGAAIRRQR